MFTAKDVMSRDVLSVDPDDTVEEVIALMVAHGIGGLPVLQKGELVGMVRRCDVLRYVLQAHLHLHVSPHRLSSPRAAGFSRSRRAHGRA